jgi:hypothetical protein
MKNGCCTACAVLGPTEDHHTGLVEYAPLLTVELCKNCHAAITLGQHRDGYIGRARRYDNGAESDRSAYVQATASVLLGMLAVLDQHAAHIDPSRRATVTAIIQAVRWSPVVRAAVPYPDAAPHLTAKPLRPIPPSARRDRDRATFQLAVLMQGTLVFVNQQMDLEGARPWPTPAN